MKKTLVIITAMAFMASPSFAATGIDGAKLFSKKCKMCHKMDKSSAAPAVRSMTTDADTQYSIIAEGKNRMPKFARKLSKDEIMALVQYLQSNMQSK